MPYYDKGFNDGPEDHMCDCCNRKKKVMDIPEGHIVFSKPIQTTTQTFYYPDGLIVEK